MIRLAEREIAVAGAVALVCLAALVAGEKPPEGTTEGELRQRTERAHKIGPHLYQLGKVTIDAKARTVRCPGRINMVKGGPIELLACRQEGKVHESVLVLDVDALDLQVALLLLNLEPGRNPAVKYAQDDPEREKKPGAMVDIYVEWKEKAGEGGGGGSGEEGERIVRRRADETLFNVVAGAPAKRTQWVFVGSRWMEGRFGAELTGTLITTYYDPMAILELPQQEVNDDIWFAVNDKVVPPLDTPVEMIIEAGQPEAKKPGDGDKKTEEK